MLSRKTLGVAGAAMLGTLALMATNVANAVIVAGGDGTHTAVKIAKEGLLDTATHTEDEVEYYLVSNAGNALDLAGNTILAPTSSLPIYLRYELENMVLGAAIADASVGGGVGADFVVMSYNTGTGGVSRTVQPTSLGVLPDMPGSRHRHGTRLRP